MFLEAIYSPHYFSSLFIIIFLQINYSSVQIYCNISYTSSVKGRELSVHVLLDPDPTKTKFLDPGPDPTKKTLDTSPGLEGSAAP